ncbi:hypothetical protein GOBAR_AA15063 [Gossypium barbadense]|uniref:Uncharacterized protein n=1 Tax=Gossypium barbadense TaxID=3634 RepID=A0A2P5XQI6_GOSBA|nr:hypothetical protein GOBAR_AA15063 [Gossypium barbadense]
MEKVRLKCGFVNGIDIDAIGSKGCLSLGWKSNELVRLKSYSSFHIDIEVQDVECGEVWHFTGFYGNPEERKEGRLRSDRQMSEFRDVLEVCGLNDMGFVGSWFTLSVQSINTSWTTVNQLIDFESSTWRKEVFLVHKLQVTYMTI